MSVETESTEEAPIVRKLAPEPEAQDSILHVDGDARVRAGRTMPHGLECTGNLLLEAGSRVDGPVNVHGNAHLAQDAAIRGSLHVHGNLDVEVGVSADALHVDGSMSLRGHLIGVGLTARRGFEIQVRPDGGGRT